MASKNPKRDRVGTMVVPELNHPVVDFEIAELKTPIVDEDVFDVSSTLFSGYQGRSIWPLKLGIDEESDNIKTTTQQSFHLSVPETSSPLGLTLKKTPSFLDLVETKLSGSYSSSLESKKRKSIDEDAGTRHINWKMKASNFSASSLQIGSWERVSRYDGDLVVKCYFAKRKFLWEILDGRLKNKIEVMWSDIASLKAIFKDHGPETLEIELLRPPLFFQETNPQPRKHTLWKASNDFTGGQSSIFRRHKLQFAQGTLQKQYERLLQLDIGLSTLSKKPYPSLDSPFFGSDDIESQHPEDFMLFGLEGQSSNVLKRMAESGVTDDHSEQTHSFTLTGKSFPSSYSNLHQPFASPETSSSSSGASNGCKGHGSSNSDSISFPSLFSSKPVSIPDVLTLNFSSSSYNIQKGPAEVIRYNSGGNYSSKPSSKWTSNSILDFSEPKRLISDAQTDSKRADSFELGNHKNKIDRGSSEFSYFTSGVFTNICSSVASPLVIVEDEAALDEIAEWTTSWT